MTIRTINNRSLRTMYLIILVQFIVIAFLLAIISNEYLSNYWMQVWIAGKAPMLAFLINGQLDSLLIGVSAAGTASGARGRLPGRTTGCRAAGK